MSHYRCPQPVDKPLDTADVSTGLASDAGWTDNPVVSRSRSLARVCVLSSPQSHAPTVCLPQVESRSPQPVDAAEDPPPPDFDATMPVEPHEGYVAPPPGHADDDEDPLTLSPLALLSVYDGVGVVAELSVVQSAVDE